MLRLIGCSCAILSAIVLAAGSSANTPPTYVGKTGLFHCTPTQTAQVDPIKAYGVIPSAHLHTAAGADLLASGGPVFTATTQPGALTATGTTTSCDVRSDHNLIWFPTVFQPNGQPASVSNVVYYIENNGYDVVRPPNGLRFVGGNPDYVGKYGSATFTCTESNGSTYEAHTIPPLSTGCKGFTIGLFAPGQCWYPNGNAGYPNDLGMGMGANEPPADITPDSAATCAANGGTQIPLFEAGETVGANGVGGYLSSDLNVDPNAKTDGQAGETAHFDIAVGFTNGTYTNPLTGSADTLSNIVTECLDQPGYQIQNTSCSTVTGTNGTYIYEDLTTNGQPDWTDPDRVVGN